MTWTKLVTSACLIVALGFIGCGGSGGSGEEEPASGEAVTVDALEACLIDEGLAVERFDGGPISFPPAGTFTPEAILVHSPAGDRTSVPRQDILVLEQEDAESLDQRLPPGVKDPNRFGANVLVFATEVSAVPIGPDSEGPVAPPRVRRALNACVN